MRDTATREILSRTNKTYIKRISHSGEMFGHEGQSLGRMWKEQGGWRHELTSTIHPTQAEARRSWHRIVNGTVR